MREWPVLSARAGAFDGVNAFRWRKAARAGGFPSPPERVEAFINIPSLLLLDGAHSANYHHLLAYSARTRRTAKLTLADPLPDLPALTGVCCHFPRPRRPPAARLGPAAADGRLRAPPHPLRWDGPGHAGAPDGHPCGGR